MYGEGRGRAYNVLTKIGPHYRRAVSPALLPDGWGELL